MAGPIRRAVSTLGKIFIRKKPAAQLARETAWRSATNAAINPARAKMVRAGAERIRKAVEGRRGRKK